MLCTYKDLPDVILISLILLMIDDIYKIVLEIIYFIERGGSM